MCSPPAIAFQFFAERCVAPFTRSVHVRIQAGLRGEAVRKVTVEIDGEHGRGEQPCDLQQERGDHHHCKELTRFDRLAAAIDDPGVNDEKTHRRQPPRQERRSAGHVVVHPPLGCIEHHVQCPGDYGGDENSGCRIEVS